MSNSRTDLTWLNDFGSIADQDRQRYLSAPVISTKKRNPAHSEARNVYEQAYRLYRLNRANLDCRAWGLLSFAQMSCFRDKLMRLSLWAYANAGSSWSRHYEPSVSTLNLRLILAAHRVAQRPTEYRPSRLQAKS